MDFKTLLDHLDLKSLSSAITGGFISVIAGWLVQHYGLTREREQLRHQQFLEAQRWEREYGAKQRDELCSIYGSALHYLSLLKDRYEFAHGGKEGELAWRRAAFEALGRLMVSHGELPPGMRHEFEIAFDEFTNEKVATGETATSLLACVVAMSKVDQALTRSVSALPPPPVPTAPAPSGKAAQ